MIAFAVYSAVLIFLGYVIGYHDGHQALATRKRTRLHSGNPNHQGDTP